MAFTTRENLKLVQRPLSAEAEELPGISSQCLIYCLVAGGGRKCWWIWEGPRMICRYDRVKRMLIVKGRMAGEGGSSDSS